MLRPFIVKVSVLGYVHLLITIYFKYIFSLYLGIYNIYIYIYIYIYIIGLFEIK